MPAPLAYTMFKSKSEYPLHTAIRTEREDVVFLYLVEHDAQVGMTSLNHFEGKCESIVLYVSIWAVKIIWPT